MKILIVRKLKDVAGGIDRSLVKIIPDLQKEGVEVAFLAANRGYIIPELEKLGIKVFLPEKDLSSLDREWERFAQESIREYQPDVLDLHQVDIILSVASFVKDKPMVGAIHSSLSDWISRKEKEDLRLTIPRLSSMHAVGFRIEQELRLLGALDVRQIFSPVQDMNYRTSARVGSDDPRLCFVGRADTRKGLDVLIQALYLVLKEFPKARLSVVGNTGTETRERGGGTDRPLAQELGVDEAIDWLGILPHRLVLQKLSGSDLLVSSSRYEGVPGVILEAHSLALPVVATSASAEAMRWGDAGLIVPRDNHFLLAQAILSDLRDPRRLTRAEENRSFVLDKYSNKQLVNTLKKSFFDARAK